VKHNFLINFITGSLNLIYWQLLLSISVLLLMGLSLYPNLLATGIESASVVIPKGSANPEVDITNLSPRQWYTPSQISINQNNTVTWINEDTEGHTVTSGTGEGLESLVNKKKGTKSGIFDSGIFRPGNNWTYRFEQPGVFTYFCTVHPWMEGTVVVKKTLAASIPKYPVDSLGHRQTVFPVHTITNDKKYDIDMGWDPKALLVGRKVSFILDFSEVLTNKRLHLLPYDFVIFQDGKEILRKEGLSQVGADTQVFTFANPGVVNIKIENVGDNNESFTEFNSTVYENPNVSQAGTNQLQNSQSSKLLANPFRVNTLTLVWITYVIIIGIPVAVALVYILYRKGIL
jgi:plastocyanin